MSGVVKPVPVDPLDDLAPAPSPFAWRGLPPDPLDDLTKSTMQPFRPSVLDRAKQAGQAMRENPGATVKGMITAPIRSAYTAGQYTSQLVHENPDRPPIGQTAGREALLQTGANLVAPELSRVPGLGRAAVAGGRELTAAGSVVGGAGVGAAYSPEDPLLGAVLGGAAGGAIHVGTSAIRQAFTGRPAFAGAPTPEAAGRVTPDETVIEHPEFVDETPPVQKLLPAAGGTSQPAAAAEPPPAWWPAGHEAEWYAEQAKGASTPPPAAADPLDDLAPSHTPGSITTIARRPGVAPGVADILLETAERMRPGMGAGEALQGVEEDDFARDNAHSQEDLATARQLLGVPRGTPQDVDQKVGSRAPEPYDQLPPIGGAEGRATQVLLRDGQSLPAVYRVVPLASLQPSHDPLTFQPNPVYPRGVQGRDYQGNEPMQQAVTAQGMALDPRVALNPSETAAEGQPTVLPNGLVLAGNTRAMLPAIAHAHNPAAYDAYVQELKGRAAQFGLDPSHVDQVQHPVLVRMLTSAKDAGDSPLRWQEINRLSDETTTKAKTAIESGAAMSQRLAAVPDLMAHYGRTVGPDDTITSYLEGPEGRQFVRGLEASGVIPKEELGRLTSGNGGLTQEGKTAIRQMMLASALTDPHVIDRAPAAAVQKIEHAIPSVMITRGTAFDLSRPLTEALDRLAEAKASGVTPRDLANQTSIFGFGSRDPHADALAQYIHEHTKKEITEAFRRYGTIAREVAAGAGHHDLFGGSGYDKAKAFAVAFGEQTGKVAEDKAPYESRDPRQQSMFGPETMGKGKLKPIKKLGAGQEQLELVKPTMGAVPKPFGRPPTSEERAFFDRVNRDAAAHEAADPKADDLPSHPGLNVRSLADTELQTMRKSLGDLLVHLRGEGGKGLQPGALDTYEADARVLDAEAARRGSVREPIKAYHGSPHTFSQFSLQKIGSGEGAQTYGWGLYLAGKREVAEYYRDMLAESPGFRHLTVGFIPVKVDGQLVDRFRWTPHGEPPTSDETNVARVMIDEIAQQEPALARLAQTDGMASVKAAIHRMIGRLADTYTRDWPEGQQALAKFRAAVSGPGGVQYQTEKAQGRLYHVEGPDDKDMLDGDKPLAKQPKAVQDAVRMALKAANFLRPTDNGPRQLTTAFDAWRTTIGSGADTGLSAYGLLVRYANQKGLIQRPPIEGTPTAGLTPAGWDVKDGAGRVYGTYAASSEAEAITQARRIGPTDSHDAHYPPVPGNEEEVSRYLASKGVPGIRYLDQGSRVEGRGSHNYVIFDDKLLNITHVESPRAKYNANQTDLFTKGELSPDHITKTYGSQKDLDLLVARVQKEAGPMVAPYTFPAGTSQARMAAIRKTSAWVDIRGQKIPTLAKLHQLLAPFRDAKTEMFGVGLLGDDGTIASHTLETSGALNYVSFGAPFTPGHRFIVALAARAKRLGVTQVLVHHNHPSGNPEPSPDDRGLTGALKDALAAHGLTLVGHYIINHETGTWLDPDGLRSEAVDARGRAGPGPDWTQAHGNRLRDANDLHQFVREADPITSLSVLYLGAQRHALALEPHDLSRIAGLSAWLPQRLRALGASDAVLLVPEQVAGMSGQALRALYGQLETQLGGSLGYDVLDVGVVHHDATGLPRVISRTQIGTYAQRPRPEDDARLPRRLFERPADAYGAGDSGAGGGEPPTAAGGAGLGGDDLVPRGAGVVQKAQSFLRQAADFWATAWHDPIAAGRRLDPEYAELGDKALAAKPFAGHFARTMAHWTDEGLTPDEATTLSRVQVINRLQEINERERQGQLEFIPEDAGEAWQRERTIRRYEALVPPGFLDRPNIQQALARRMQVYRDVMEPAAIEGNVDPAKFSRSTTGHIKLIPLATRAAIEGGELLGEQHGARTKTARAAQHAKGTALDYELDWQTLLASDARDKFQAAATNRFLRGTHARGREIPPGAVTRPGEIRVTFPDPANVIPDQGPKITVGLPKPLGQAFGHVDKKLARKGAPTSDLGALARAVDNVAGRMVFTLNPAALLSHARNMSAALASVPEAGPWGWLKAATGLGPGAKQLRGLSELMVLDLRTPEARGVKMRLASVGALRPLESSYAFLEGKLARAKADFATRVRNRLSPGQLAQVQKLSVFGENGIDERARVGLALKYLKQAPTATDAELGHYVNRLAANYTRGLGGVAIDGLQSAKLSMFARIQTAKLGLGARTALGHSLLPSHSAPQAAELWVKQLMLGPWGNKAGLAAVIAAASLLLAKHLTQAPGKENDIPTGQVDDQGREIYISGRFLTPTDEVTQDLGLDQLASGDTRGAIQNVKNTALRIGFSHPIGRTVFAAASGAEPRVDRQGHVIPLGPPNLSGLPKLKAIAKVGTGLTAAAPFGPDVTRNPGLPPAIGKTLSYLGANVTTAAQPAAEGRTRMDRADETAWQDGVIQRIFREADHDKRQAIMDDAMNEARDAGFTGPKIRGTLTKAVNRAGIDRSAAALTRFRNQIGGHAP